MARPSIVRERRKQILDAFEDCILEHGIRGASFNRIGEIVGLDGSTLHHYYRTRAKLLDALVERIKDDYARRIEEVLSLLPRERRVRALIDHLFSANFEQPRLARITDEIRTEAARNQDVHQYMKRAYQMLDDIVVTELEKEFPNAPAEEHRDVAHGLASLTVGATAYTLLGLGPERRRASRLMALRLVETLRRNS